MSMNVVTCIKISFEAYKCVSEHRMLITCANVHNNVRQCAYCGLTCIMLYIDVQSKVHACNVHINAHKQPLKQINLH